MWKSISFIFLVPLALSGQMDWAVFGELRPSELRSDTSWASESGVEVLFDLGIVQFDKKGFDIEFYRHERIKIYKVDSLDSSSISIPFKKGDRIRRPRAIRYHWVKGRVSRQELRSNKITISDKDARNNELSFHFKGLEDGDVIEYAYEMVYEEWRDLDRWWFQDHIPVRRSDYIVAVPEYFEFLELSSTDLPYDRYEVSKKKVADYDVTTYHYGMERFQAFIEEPYSNSSLDYRRNLLLSLTSVHIPDVVDRDYSALDYKALVEELVSNPRYGRELKNNAFLNPILDSICTPGMEELQRAKRIYSYVQNRFRREEGDPNQSLRSILRSEKGNSWDINRFLVALLRQSEIEAYPLLLNSGGTSKVTTEERVNTVFDQLFCCSIIEDQDVVLDASDGFLPFGYLSLKHRIGKGLLLNSAEPRYVDVEKGAEDKRVYSGSMVIDSSLTVTAEFDELYLDYGAYLFRWESLSSVPPQYTDSYDIQGEFTTTEVSDREVAVHIETQWSLDSLSADSVLRFDPFHIAGIKVNPFKKEFRQQPVSFPAPFERRISYSIVLPEGLSLIEFPESIDIGLPDDAGYFRYLVSEVGEMIVVSSQLKINKKSFYQEDYPYLKAIYDHMIEKHTEGLLLKWSQF